MSSENPKPHFCFNDRAYQVIQSVPAGHVTTYGDVAVAMGSPGAARQVGYALARLPQHLISVVPWHRVINSQGTISHRGDLHRAAEQRRLLESENIVFNARGKVNLKHIRWHFPDLLDSRATE